MRLSVSHSTALETLILTEQVRVDAIEWVDELSLTEIESGRSRLKGLSAHFHPGSVRFSEAGLRHLTNYLAACPESEVLSIHLTLLPRWISQPALKWRMYMPDWGGCGAVEHFISQVRWLQDQFDQPVILENMRALHPSRYRYETEPDNIRRVLADTGCELLLDLAHARIAAEARQMDVREYLKQLPLELTRQIHVNGARPDPRTGRLADAHESMREEDFELLEWILARANPRWLTFEYFREEPEILKAQLNRLSQFL